MENTKFVPLEEVLVIHNRMLAIGGGLDGIRDLDLLVSALQRPQSVFAGKFLYPTIWLQAAALLHSLINNHPFIDGNKRTAVFVTLRFLELNKVNMTLTNKEIVDLPVKIVREQADVIEISGWLKELAN